MIVGGESLTGGRKRPRKEVYMARTSYPIPTITITPEDGLHVKQPHNDALVINAHIKNFLVRRLLVDDGSAVNVLTWEAFRAMGGSSVELKPITNPITSFCRGTIRPMGSAELDIELGERET